MIEHKLIRCDPDDPNRCQSSNSFGQCPYKAVENSKYCQRHGSNSQQQAIMQESLRQYRLTKWRARLNDFTDSESIISLREEIGVLRILMEETLNHCNDATTLLLYSHKISDLALKIEKLVASCRRLENSMGLLLDKTSAIILAGKIVDIISNHVTDSKIIDLISNDIIEALASSNA